MYWPDFHTSEDWCNKSVLHILKSCIQAHINTQPDQYNLTIIHSRSQSIIPRRTANVTDDHVAIPITGSFVWILRAEPSVSIDSSPCQISFMQYFLLKTSTLQNDWLSMDAPITNRPTSPHALHWSLMNPLCHVVTDRFLALNALLFHVQTNSSFLHCK